MNDKRKEYLKKWREDNKEHIRKYKKEYAKTHDSSFKKLQDKYKQLQQENKKLNGAIQTYDILLKSNIEENKQLKAQIEEYQKALDETMSEKIDIQNNWNELKEYIYNQIPTDKTVLTKHIKIFEVLDKMQELEGSDSNE